MIINPNEYGILLYDEKEKENLNTVIDNKKIFRYSKMPKNFVLEFEDAVCKKINAKYCLGVINGTAGLITALNGLGINKGDKVLVSSYTFVATALAVILCGGIPIPLEIDLENGVDLDDLEEQISSQKPKICIITHLQGRCFNLEKVVKILKQHNVWLIEDSCQAFLAKNKDKDAGTFGDVGVYSFQQGKQISSGEGGAIVTNSNEIFTRARNYSDMGSQRNHFPNWNAEECLFGQNYRMSNIIGALLMAQMDKADEIIKKQKKSSKRILKKIKNYENIIILNSSDYDGQTGMNIIFKSNLIKDTESFIKYAKEEKNVEIRFMWRNTYYDNNLFIRNKLTAKDLKGKECVKTKKIAKNMLVISIPPILNTEEEDIIVDLFGEINNGKFN